MTPKHTSATLAVRVRNCEKHADIVHEGSDEDGPTAAEPLNLFRRYLDPYVFRVPYYGFLIEIFKKVSYSWLR